MKQPGPIRHDKLPPELLEHIRAVYEVAALSAPRVVEFHVTGRPLRGWIVMDADGPETDEQLGGWIQRAVRFVGLLPSK